MGWFKEPAHVGRQYSKLPKLIGAIFVRDSSAGLALALDFPHRWTRPDEAGAWIKPDPAAATKACLALSAKNYLAAAEKTMTTWAETDPKAAAACRAGLRHAGRSRL